MPALTQLPPAGSSRIQYRVISVLQVSILLRVDCQRLQGRKEMSADSYCESRYGLSHSRQALFRLLRLGHTVRSSDPDVPYRR